MRLFKKMQERLLQRDIDKGKGSQYLAKKYQMALLLEKGAFERFKNTQFYAPKDSTALFKINGEFVGTYFRPGKQFPMAQQEDIKKYVVVLGEASYSKYDKGETKASFAVYDINAECVIPHGCYMNAYQANNYVVLSMPMDNRYCRKPERIETENDNEMKMPATGKSLKESIGDTKNPRVLIVKEDEIVKTSYMAIQPAISKSWQDQPLANNIIWIAQKTNREEVALKLDKRYYITETYSLPMYSHQDTVHLYEDPENGGVYKIEIKDQIPQRVNLRTGQLINLLTLKKSNLLKKDRVNENKPTQEVEKAEEVETTL